MNYESIIKKYKHLEKKNIEDNTELKIIEERLKKEFNCNNLKEAKDKINEMKKHKIFMENKKFNLLNELNNMTDWDEINTDESNF